MLRDHVKLQSWGVGVAVLVSILWMGSSDLWRARLRLPLLALLLIATGLSVIGSWHAGEAVYRHGTGVQLQPATLAEASTQPEATPSRKWDEYYVQPLQFHVLIAGGTIALALASLGLSLRAANSDAPRTQVDYIAEALGPVAGDPKPSARPDRPGAEPQDRAPRIPAARFWLLTMLVGLLTALAGDWVLAKSMGSWDPKQLWEQVRQPMENATYPWLTRRLAHVGGGVSIVVLSLLMAIAARLARRSKLVVLFFGLLLLAVIAAQVWFGVLLMFDTVEGPVTKFN
jgi:hypothetical protein